MLLANPGKRSAWKNQLKAIYHFLIFSGKGMMSKVNAIVRGDGPFTVHTEDILQMGFHPSRRRRNLPPSAHSENCWPSPPDL